MDNHEEFQQRRIHLDNLDDSQLKKHFWELTSQIVNPLIELAQTHTSPSVERSVLLRMGFSSIETKEIVSRCVENGLLGKGAGHAVWRLANIAKISCREAGLLLAKGECWQQLCEYWEAKTNET